jgi:DNA-binding CsgD family transcriptional regulator
LVSRSKNARYRPNAVHSNSASGPSSCHEQRQAGRRRPRQPAWGRLSLPERELVTLVAQGQTDAQIAAQLYISVRTASSYLARIRDKTGCRRRADLTRLALSADLV